jgi:hypothetical protein
LTGFYVKSRRGIVEGGHFGGAERAIVYAGFVDEAVHLVGIGDGVVSGTVVIIQKR